MALHNYHDAFRLFPPGYVEVNITTGSVDCTGGNCQNHFGWGSYILPYLDQAPLYNKLNFSTQWARPTASGGSETEAKTILPAYICPSDPTGEINLTSVFAALAVAKSNYVGFTGSTLHAGTTGLGANGIFSKNSRTKIRDITDGTSNTMIVGERDSSGRGSIWVGQGSFSPTANGRTADNLGLATSGTFLINGTSTFAFSSRHEGGIHVLLADGHVRFLSENMNLTTWRNLAAMADDKVLGEY